MRTLFKGCTRLWPNQQREAFYPFGVKHLFFNKPQGFFPYYRFCRIFWENALFSCLVSTSAGYGWLSKWLWLLQSIPSLLLASDWRVFSSCFSGHSVVLLEREGSTTSISFIQFTPTLLFCKLEKKKKKSLVWRAECSIRSFGHLVKLLSVIGDTNLP